MVFVYLKPCLFSHMWLLKVCDDESHSHHTHSNTHIHTLQKATDYINCITIFCLFLISFCLSSSLASFCSPPLSRTHWVLSLTYVSCGWTGTSWPYYHLWVQSTPHWLLSVWGCLRLCVLGCLASGLAYLKITSWLLWKDLVPALDTESGSDRHVLGFLQSFFLPIHVHRSLVTCAGSCAWTSPRTVWRNCPMSWAVCWPSPTYCSPRTSWRSSPIALVSRGGEERAEGR